MSHELNPHDSVSPHGITLSDSYWEFAKQLGSGNASKGIRRALYEMSLGNSDKAISEDTSRKADEIRIL